jgi:hypothetical protein
VRFAPVLGGILAVAAAALVLWLQPAREAWWHWADPDGAYVGSSLNILMGNHTNYLDHPGLPTQAALAIGFGAEYLVGKSRGEYDDRLAFANAKMLDLDSTRHVYRSWAVALFLGATLLVYLLVGRLLGHWTWGLAGSLVFVSAPGLGAISFLLRPDAALAALCLAVGYLVARGFDGPSTLHYTGAAALLGFSMTVKLTAVAMVVPLVVAVVWRPPASGWFGPTVSTLATWGRKHALWLVPSIVAWLVLSFVFNRERTPIVQTDDQRAVLVNGGAFLLCYAAFAFVTERFRIAWADRIFRLSYAWLMLAFVIGLALPASLVLDDGIQMIVAMKETLTGQRVNEGIEPFANFTTSSVTKYPLNVGVIVIGMGLVAGGIGLARRQYWPFLLALGSLVLATMAAARYSYDYYYAPAVAVAIPGALWLVRRTSRVAAPVVVLAAAVALFGLTIGKVQTWEPPREAAVDAAAQALADELLVAGDVILVQDYYDFPVEDVRFEGLVDGFVDHVPEYPYRFLSSPGTAGERGLVPRYVVGRDELPEAGDVASIDVGGYGPFVVEGLQRRWGPGGTYRLARVVESPPLSPS